MIGCAALGSGMMGYLTGRLQLFMRGALLAAGLLLIKPGAETDLWGAAILLAVLALQQVRARMARKTQEAGSPGTR